MRGKTRKVLWIAGAALVAGAGALAASNLASKDAGRAVAATAPPAQVAQVARYPDRTAYYGDLHLHTANSFDAYTLAKTRVGPDDAYRFAAGETIDYLGQPVRRRWPLDFMAVTDHVENMGLVNAIVASKGSLGGQDLYDIVVKGGMAGMKAVIAYVSSPRGKQELAPPKSMLKDTWEQDVAAANSHYRPGKFTTFVAYEYTATKEGANLHRNVIFRGAAPLPFSSRDSQDPADLWKYLQSIRAEGFEALAIPHNSNASNGLMFDWTTLDGRPIDRAYADLRAANEPLMEIAQEKGTSETHPELSANDEFSNFEIFDQFLSAPTKSRPGGSYARDALTRGMLIEQKTGMNPYKLGFVGGSDLHGGLSVSAQADYRGNIGFVNLGGGRPTDFQAKAALGQAKDPEVWDSYPPLITSSGALTAVWAESNTREDIYAALRRRETFATSGTRIRVRAFGGWALPADLLSRPDWVHAAYGLGAPMGGDLPSPTTPGARPKFAIQAVKDPDGANLDRVQVVKVWIAGGERHERVFDVAWAGSRKPDAKTGKVAAIGDTVDLKTGEYSNSIGAAELQTLWTDETFRPDEQSAYYVRVLEIPTPRWSTLLALQHKLPFPASAHLTTQQRAWSSPIWYDPVRER